MQHKNSHHLSQELLSTDHQVRSPSGRGQLGRNPRPPPSLLGPCRILGLVDTPPISRDPVTVINRILSPPSPLPRVRCRSVDRCIETGTARVWRVRGDGVIAQRWWWCGCQGRFFLSVAAALPSGAAGRLPWVDRETERERCLPDDPAEESLAVEQCHQTVVHHSNTSKSNTRANASRCKCKSKHLLALLNPARARPLSAQRRG